MTTTLKDYYKILGIDRKATEKEIKAAFRKAARQVHPDLQSKEDKAAAEEKFKEINEACSVLSDPEKRVQYDRLLDYGASGGAWEHHPDMAGQDYGQSWNPPDMDDINSILESLFGGRESAASGGRTRPSRTRHAVATRGQDLSGEIALTLEEAYHGCMKTLQFSSAEGVTAGQKTLEVNIPAFVRDGSKIRLKGQGSEGRGGGTRGDLLMTVRLLPHSRFSLKADNLETSARIRPDEAVLGCRLTVPTLDRDVEITVPPGTHHGRKLRIRGKGWAGEGGKRGDLLVSIVIDIPDTLSPAEQELYQKLADMRKKDRTWT